MSFHDLPTNWYFSGTPGVYGTLRGALVSSPNTDTDFLYWKSLYGPPNPWPNDSTGSQTADSLDLVLVEAGLPPTGLASVATLGAQVVSAAEQAASSIVDQVRSTSSQDTALQNAVSIVIANGSAPSDGNPYYLAYNALASTWGKSPSAFATLIQVMVNQSMNLSSAVNTLKASVAAATTNANLTTALATFETSLAAVVTAVNAAGPPIAIVAPAAISIKGVD